jgi:hypothetical protein
VRAVGLYVLHMLVLGPESYCIVQGMPIPHTEGGYTVFFERYHRLRCLVVSHAFQRGHRPGRNRICVLQRPATDSLENARSGFRGRPTSFTDKTRLCATRVETKTGSRMQVVKGVETVAMLRVRCVHCHESQGCMLCAVCVRRRGYMLCWTHREDGACA